MSDGICIHVWRTDYWYFGHYTITGGIPWNRGWGRGFGFFMIEVLWDAHGQFK